MKHSPSVAPVTFPFGKGTAELTVLADDLFRFRVSRTKKFSPLPSWAVAKTDWGPATSKVSRRSNQISLHTASGKLTFWPRDGTWKLHDSSQRLLFRATIGFVKGKAYVTLRLRENEAVFGLGETTNTFNKRGQIREFWNIDVAAHVSVIHPAVRQLYAAIPFGISLHEGRAAGIFWDNPGRQIWDIGRADLDEWKMDAETGDIDLYLFLGPSVQNIVSRYAELTGHMPLPPRWALGYQQSRYSYPTRKRVEEIARTFRQKKIPCDVIHLDIHYMDGYRVFTFGKAFPKPAEMIRRLRHLGFKVVTIVDPGVKDDPEFGVLERGRKLRCFVKAPTGRRDQVGAVWPGPAHFPDFLNAAARRWWGSEQAAFQKLGVSGFWNDMNEPAIFDLPGKTLPDQCLHHTDNGTVPHGTVHNVYGMQMARASYEGALAHAPDQRPFIITRAGYAGVQRYALVWTGDNSSIWEHLADSIPMLLNLSVSGVPFCGADAGGFIDSTTGELLARWMQLAAFTPFFRNHSNWETRDQEPWAFGSRVEAICRQAIERRYRLLPYLYCLFAEAHRHATPIMRPMFWNWQDDPIAAGLSDQFMLGPDLLVAPILRQAATARSVYLPRGDWYDFNTGEKVSGGRHVLAQAELETIPLFVRAGAIIPMAPVQQFVGEKSIDAIELHLWAGGDGDLKWYEDDGATQGYIEGAFAERAVHFAGGGAQMELSMEAVKGTYISEVRQWTIVVHSAKQGLTSTVNGNLVPTQFKKAKGTTEFHIANIPDAIQINLGYQNPA